MKELLKYLVYALVVYIILTLIPENNMCFNDTLLAMVIIISLAYCYDKYFENKKMSEGYDPYDPEIEYSGVFKGEQNKPYYKLQGVSAENKEQDVPSMNEIIKDTGYKGLQEDKKIVEKLQEKVEERKENLKEIKKVEPKFQYGYAYMHPDYWGGLPFKRKPVCRNQKPCSVCPKKTEGYNQMLMKFE
jgi:hypothetical protein